ncbi:MAG: DUF4377 domain-containing protein [Tannerellaceae bacterium]|nr:DUF4377 domain-containing protein [Tannerellaceae bacterium]
MKKKNGYVFLCFAFLSGALFSCLDNENADKEKLVEMTIYPETGYGSNILSDIWTEPLIFSESDDKEKRQLMDIITEGFDFEYERGYEYTFKAKKVWMSNPPQDVSSIKYIYVGDLTKKKVITKDSEEEVKLFISPETVKFSPRFPTEYEDGYIKIYNALLAKVTDANRWLVLTEIEGFDFENGYEYTLTAKKITQADPYSVKYILLNVSDKQKAK